MSILVSNSLARGLRRERAVDTRTADRQWLHWAWLPVLAGLGLSLLGIAAIGTTEPVLAQRQLGFLIVGCLHGRPRDRTLTDTSDDWNDAIAR